MAKISEFIRHHYRHFNAAALIDAADGYARHIDQGGKMFMTLAGAMSTAELGLSLAEMIRRGKVHAICCTGANLEEDLFNLVAHDHYVRVPHYRELTPQQEEDLLRSASEPRHRHVHSRRGSDPAHRTRDRRRVGCRGSGRASTSSPTNTCTRCCARASSTAASRSTRRTRGCTRRTSAICRSSCRVGKTRRLATSSRRT